MSFEDRWNRRFRTPAAPKGPGRRFPGQLPEDPTITQKRIFQRHITSRLAEPEVSGFNSHYKFYIDEYGELIRLGEQMSKKAIPVGHPVQVSQWLDDAWHTGDVDGVDAVFLTHDRVVDGHHTEWNGTVTSDDLELDDDTVKMTISEFYNQEDRAVSRVSSAPAAASTITYNYHAPCVGELNALHGMDNGKMMEMLPLAGSGSTPALGIYMVCLFAVPQIKSNTQIKGHLRMAADDTCTTFEQKMYDFTAGSWSEMQADADLAFSPDAADTTFQIYTFTVDHNDFVSDDNLMAIAWRGKATGTVDHVAFYLDYAWAWLDRKSGWF
jgi:hypothetical protein